VVARIKLRDREERELYLLVRNEKRRRQGRLVFTPIGGTIRLVESDSIEEALRQLMAEPEAEVSKGSRPLRYRLPAFHLPQFEDLWLAGVRNQLLLGVAKQVADRLPKALQNGACEPKFAGTVCDYDLTDRIGARGELTRRYSTVFDFQLSQEVTNRLLGCANRGRLLLATSQEIFSGLSNESPRNKAVLIGANAKALLRADSTHSSHS
jgi:hypothetical protein